MSALAVSPAAGAAIDPLLTNDVLAHLDAQIASAARLLEVVLAQGAAIRARDVDATVRQITAFQAELERRSRVEEDRARLLERAAAALRLAPGEITLTRIGTLMGPREAQLAAERSAELQRLLAELGREHALNQALMRQELAFLDHLLGQLEPVASVGYEAGGARSTKPTTPPPGHRTLDLHA